MGVPSEENIKTADEPSDNKLVEASPPESKETKDERVEAVKMDEDIKIDTKSEKPLELKDEMPKLKKVIKPKEKEVKNEDLKKKDETEKSPFGAKLRKTETVKREIKEAKLEAVQLKHHQFEVQPRDTDLEQTTGVILGDPLVSLDEGREAVKKADDNKGDKKRKIKKQKKRDTESKEPVVVEVLDEVVPSDDNIKTEEEPEDEPILPEAKETEVEIEVEVKEEEA